MHHGAKGFLSPLVSSLTVCDSSNPRRWHLHADICLWISHVLVFSLDSSRGRTRWFEGFTGILKELKLLASMLHHWIKDDLDWSDIITWVPTKKKQMRSGLEATGHSHDSKEHVNLSQQFVGVPKQPCRKNAFRDVSAFLWRLQITSRLASNGKSCDWERAALQWVMSENISAHDEWCLNGDAVQGFVGGKHFLFAFSDRARPTIAWLSCRPAESWMPFTGILGKDVKMGT